MFYTPGAAGKRKRVFVEEAVNPGRRTVKVARKTSSSVRRPRARKGGPNLKQRLLRDLRAQRKRLKAELKQIERDYRSLLCRRRKPKEE